jgi:tRNA threonylcarbamoyladenosine biosynthesis protein TsaE
LHGGSFDVPDAEVMRALGHKVAGWLRAGDLVVLTGSLGAGKTTFTQGLGAGLGVRGAVVGGPDLVHVDAYRIGGIAELDDLDLDTSLDDAVTVVEWGGGLAEGLADSRLEVHINRSGDAESEERRVEITAVGPRWLGTPAGTPAGEPR